MNFRFWNFGQWVDVVIDDKLPVNEYNQLIYCHNRKEPNEFFGPLLEKAYAKLNGCYEFLNAGFPTESLTDLTGAVCETFDIVKCVKETEQKKLMGAYYNPQFQSTDLSSLWKFIINSYRMKSLMNSSFYSSNEGGSIEKRFPNGLVANHAYSVTQAVSFRLGKSKRVRLLKLRNPWG